MLPRPFLPGTPRAALSWQLGLCGSRTHLTPLLQQPARGCLHPVLAGDGRQGPRERDATAQSSGRLRRQRRSRLLPPGKLPRTRPRSRFAPGGSAPPAAQRSPIGRGIAAAHLAAREVSRAHLPPGLGGEAEEITTAPWGSAQWLVVLTDPPDKGLTCV